MHPEIADRIIASLTDPTIDPWVPELAQELAFREWSRLQEISVTQNVYGTTRIMSRDVCARRDIVASLPFGSGIQECTLINIEDLGDECALPYLKAGISFYSRHEVLNTTMLSCLEDALSLINSVPDLMGTVSSLVCMLHPIKPVNIDYDFSFSEPHVPFSIFISVPSQRIVNDALRVAEAVVHETMHLQLSLIEKEVKLVNLADFEFFSPWRKENRPAQGVLHAIYVFKGIDSFIKQLLAYPLPTETLNYMIARRRKIARELRRVRSFSNSSALTKVGTQLVKKFCEPSPL